VEARLTLTLAKTPRTHSQADTRPFKATLAVAAIWGLFLKSYLISLRIVGL
jgi:hypothetical protein